jgi:plasmid stability protein
MCYADYVGLGATMVNLTLTMDEEELKRARIRALELGTSVNALVREYLRQLGGRSTAAEGLAEFLAATQDAGASSGTEGRRWSRDDVYER